MRLLVAALTGLSMLHLTLVGSGLACSSTEAERAQGVMAMTEASSHRAHAEAAAPAGAPAHANPDPAKQHGEHGTPAQERCCESMSSCGVATAAAEARHTGSFSTTAIPADADDVLASLRVGPEPPPPKA